MDYGLNCTHHWRCRSCCLSGPLVRRDGVDLDLRRLAREAHNKVNSRCQVLAIDIWKLRMAVLGDPTDRDGKPIEVKP